MSEPLPATAIKRLRALTPARVGLGRTGVSQQTSDLLEFQRAHAMARDAVHARLDAASLSAGLRQSTGLEVVRLHSRAPDRAIYLQRPDLGRKLDARSRELLDGLPREAFELVIIVADGLSALAVERHAPALLAHLLPRFGGWRVAPLCVAEQGRVALGDENGEAIGAELSVVLLGERPGLSAPDSLGAYITWQPRPGRTDAERNCISNIRSEGLSYDRASAQLEFYLTEARRRRLTGVALKQESHQIGGE
jgi:ethanolamine ammonia-lyase small subunit